MTRIARPVRSLKGIWPPKFYVCDDDSSLAKDLAAKLFAKYQAECKVASTLKTAYKLIGQKADVHAISMDSIWSSGIPRGRDLLHHVLISKPAASVIVYSADAKNVEESLSQGAHGGVVKDSDRHTREKYAEAMFQGARLSLMRQAVSLIRRAKVEFREPPHAISEIGAFENASRTEATCVASRLHVDGTPDHALDEMLVALGWWNVQALDPEEYLDLPWHRKLACLVAWAGLDFEQVARILNVNIDQTEQFLLTGIGFGEDSVRAADILLSICAFSLRVSREDPYGMFYQWRYKGLVRPKSPPPWAKVGMSVFLTETQRVGLKDALRWIRGAG